MNSKFSTGLLIIVLTLIFIMASFTASATNLPNRTTTNKKTVKKTNSQKTSSKKAKRKNNIKPVQDLPPAEQEVIKDDIIVGYNDGTDDVAVTNLEAQNVKVTNIVIDEPVNSEKTIDSIEVMKIESKNRQSSYFSVQNGTKFDELLLTYQNGKSKVDNEKIMGWWSGRCYHTREKNKPYGSVLIVEDIKTYRGHADHGPLWPPQLIKVPNMSIANQNGIEEEPGRYDNLSEADALVLEKYVKSESFRGLKVTNSEDSLQSLNTVGNLKYSAKIASNFIIVKVQVIEAQERYQADDVHSMCYYFRKLK